MMDTDWNELNRVTFNYEEVTPQQAAAWLANAHPRQRRPGATKVGKYSKLVGTPLWESIVPDPVCLTPPEDGRRMINGGHRCTSIVKSGRPQVLLVARNVPARVFDVIDIPNTRTARQFVDGKDGNYQQQAARWLMWYETRFSTKPSRGAREYQLREVIEYAEAHRDEIEPAVIAALPAAGAGVRVPAGLHAAVLVLARRGRVDGAQLADWATGLATGANLPVGDPRLVLRSLFVASGKHPSPSDDWYYIVTALNAFVTGDSVKLTKVPEFVWPRVGEDRAAFQRRLNATRKARQRVPVSTQKAGHPKPTTTADAYVMREVVSATGKTFADFR